ncbi:MAG TPA: bifunctional nicotinamidase/pyrazinamidase [Gammaproteobacteria bacterium]
MIDRHRSCLLVVDVQNDFLPGGALAVADGDAILEPLRALLAARPCRRVVATQDWHPRGHVSFASSHPGRKPFETVELYGREQVLWPDHCVAGTPGAALHADLPLETVDAIVRKGTDPAVDSYSAFRNNFDATGARPTTGLAGYLRELGVKQVLICGLARDFCVRWSAEDAAELGFDTRVIWDLTRPVDPGNDDAVRRSFADRGIRIVRSDALDEAA